MGIGCSCAGATPRSHRVEGHERRRDENAIIVGRFCHFYEALLDHVVVDEDAHGARSLRVLHLQHEGARREPRVASANKDDGILVIKALRKWKAGVRRVGDLRRGATRHLSCICSDRGRARKTRG